MAVFRCPHCQFTFPVEQAAQPRKVACPKCAGAMQVPAVQRRAEAGALTFACPFCHAANPARTENAGKLVRCAACNRVCTIPGQAPAASKGPDRVVVRPAGTTRRLTHLGPLFAAALVLLIVIASGIAAVHFSGVSKFNSEGQQDSQTTPTALAAYTGRSLQTPPKKSAAVSDLPFLRSARRALFSFRVAEIWASKPVQKLWDMLPPEAKEQSDRMSETFGFNINDIERVSVALFDETEKDAFAVIKLSAPWDAARREKILGQARNVGWTLKNEGEMEYWEGNVPEGVPDRPIESLAVYLASDRVFVAGPPWSIQRLLKQLASGKAAPDGPLADIVDKLDKDRPQIVFSAVIKNDDRVWMPVASATRSSLMATFGPSQLDLNGTISFIDTASMDAWADQFETLVKKAKAMNAMAPPGQTGQARMMAEFLKLMTELKVDRRDKDAVLHTTVDMDRMVAALPKTLPFPVLEKAEELSGAKNLREIAAALNRYHDANRQFPPLIYFSKDGRPLYSWRVCLLPYLGPAEKELYGKLDLEKAWDDTDNGCPNQRLLEQIPAVYSYPGLHGTNGKRYTPFQLLTGPGGSFAPGRRTTRESIKDRAGKTLLLITTRKAVPWAAPAEDVRVPDNAATVAKEVLPFLGLAANSPIETVLFDQTVRKLPPAITALEFLELSRPDGKSVPPAKPAPPDDAK